MSSYIRDMTKADIDPVGEILYEAFSDVASKYGYASILTSVQEGKSWAWAMCHYGASEGLVAVVDDHVVGVVFLNRRGDVGGAGPMAINRAFQGKTITVKLMSAFLERAEGLTSIRVVQEAFNPVSFSFLYAYEFKPVAELLDLYLHGNARESLKLQSNVSELTAKELDAVLTYDAARSGFDRRADLAYNIRWGKVLVYRDQSQIRGYLACLPSSRSVQLGPLLAEGEEEAECLFRHALAVFEGRSCRTRVMARDFQFARALMKVGFRLYCLNILMVRGTWRPSRYIEAFGRFPEGI